MKHRIQFPVREFEIMRSQAKDSTVAWSTPSIKGRNTGFRPTGRSRPNRSCKGRAEWF
jgi:hypothetical protein